MKKKALKKDFYMEIKKTKNRFLSIFLIVALGVAFFAGLRSTGPNMRMSADKQYKESNLMDIRVIGTLGLTDEDVLAINGIDSVAVVEPSYSADVLCNIEDGQIVVKLMSSLDNLNQITVTQGRLPEKPNECLADSSFIYRMGYKIGDVINVESGTQDLISDTVSETEFTIVGIGNTSYYLSLERGSSKIGNGSVSSFIIIPKETFNMEYYTEIYLSVENAKELDAYTKQYDELIDITLNEIEKIAGERCEIRYAEIIKKANDKIADAEEEIKDGEQKLADAKKEIEDGEEKLAKAKKKLAKKEKELIDGENTLKDKEKELEDGKQKITSGFKELNEGKELLASKKKDYESGKREVERNRKLLENAKEELEENKVLLEQGKKELDDNKALILQRKQEIESSRELIGEETAELLLQEILLGEAELISVEEELNKNEIKLLEGEQELILNEEKIKEAEKELSDAEVLIKEAEQELKDSEKLLIEKQADIDEGQIKITDAKNDIEDGKKAIEEAKEELADGEKELADGIAEYEEAVLENEPKIADAKEKIEEAKKDVADIKFPEWYVLDRQSIQAYVEYGQDADKISAIGVVFPIIFFLVATLVSLTTMTRMVEEERTGIGTLKALGYNKVDIASKYILYALFATVSGSIFGFIFGQKLLPYIIINAYKSLYHSLEYVVTDISVEQSVISTLIAVLCTTFATMIVCYKELMQNPAQLMRPTAPRAGKRVFAERITFIWNRLNFTKKATIRNLIRYKKRFFMTVFGIGGCMAILLLGFGIRDSVMLIGHIQFNKIKVFDSTINIEKDTKEEEKQLLYEEINNSEYVKSYMPAKEHSVTAIYEGSERDCNIYIPKEPDKLGEFITLQDRLTKDKYELNDEGVIITEKLANLLGVEKGDTIYLRYDDVGQVSVSVTNITENYLLHYIYITPYLYEKLFNEKPFYNQIITINIQNDTEFEDRFRKAYIDNEYISDIQFISKSERLMDDMLGTMNIVIYVLVVAAGLLAFVVLYNLNNINISERKRELATLKVLGFYDLEVSEYMLRENFILTSIGSIIGVFLGIILHKYIVVTVEIDIMMFGRNIEFASYIYSIALTFVFSAIVNWFMHYSLRKINMVESMKSVE